MKRIDADHFFDEIKKQDLEFMQQSDLMECIKSLLDAEPEIDRNESRTEQTELSYIDILNLLSESLSTDTMMPSAIKDSICEDIKNLCERLWPYSA